MSDRISPFQVVRDFERALCEYTGALYAVTTTSCTMALLLAVAYHLRYLSPHPMNPVGPRIEIPRRTYVGVPYAIREAGGLVAFRDENWAGAYQLKPLPIWDSARWLTGGMYGRPGYCSACELIHFQEGGHMICVSFHWSKTLGVEQGGAILHDDPLADAWLRRARFDGRAEGVPPAEDGFLLRRAWHAYMSPEVAAAGLVRLSHLPKYNDPLPLDNYPDLSTLAAFQ